MQKDVGERPGQRKAVVWVSDIVLTALFPICFCSLPTDLHPLQWNVSATIPFINESVNIHTRLQKIDIKSFSWLEGDTIGMCYNDSIQQTTEILPSIQLTEHSQQQTIGPLHIDQAIPVTKHLSFPVQGIITGNIPCSLSTGIGFPGILSFEGDSISSPIQMILKNKANSLSIKNISVSIFISEEETITLQIDTLAPGDSTKQSIAAIGRQFQFPLRMTIAMTLCGNNGTTITAGEGYGITFNYADITLSEITCTDTLVTVTTQLTSPLLISNSLLVHNIDLDSFIVSCEVINQTGLPVMVTAIMSHLWDQSFCRTRKLTNYTHLSQNITSIDSVSFWKSRLFSDTIPAGQQKNPYQTAITLHHLRMLPFWSDTTTGSLAYLSVSVRSLPSGKIVHLSKRSAVFFSLRPVKYTIRSLLCRPSVPLCKIFNGPLVLAPQIALVSIFDSLYGKLTFAQSRALNNLLLQLPDSSFMDSAHIGITINYSTYNHIPKKITKDTTLVALTDSSRIVIPIDLQDLFNSFADSIWLSLSLKIPPATMINFQTHRASEKVNDFSIHLVNRYRFTFPCAWTIVDTACIPTRTHNFDVPIKEVPQLKQLDNLTMIASYTLRNASSLNTRIFALAATKKNRSLLQALADSSIHPAGAWMKQSDIFFSLLDTNWCTIPVKGGITHQQTTFTPKELDQILSDDSLCVRLRIVLPPLPNSALLKSDSITITSSLQLSGIATIDSLAPRNGGNR
jgi:hypothetical protein